MINYCIACTCGDGGGGSEKGARGIVFRNQARVLSLRLSSQDRAYSFPPYTHDFQGRARETPRAPHSPPFSFSAFRTAKENRGRRSAKAARRQNAFLLPTQADHESATTKRRWGVAYSPLPHSPPTRGLGPHPGACMRPMMAAKRKSSASLPPG